MILGFSKVFKMGKTLKGKPTRFKEKIAAGTKIHSMREDRHKRWRVGMSMQLAYGVRTLYYDCFKPNEVCKRIDEVEIKYLPGNGTPRVTINGRVLGIMEVVMFAANDGFDSLPDFCEYFHENGTYRLLHWTDFIYDGDRAKLQAVNDRHLEFYQSFPQTMEYKQPE